MTRLNRRSMAAYSVAAHAEGKSAADERMDRYHEHVGRRRTERAVWPGAAFIVEALLLLVFLAGSLAVLMEVNAAADVRGKESARLVNALTFASNSAESFAADPEGALAGTSVVADVTDGNVQYAWDLALVREVAVEPTEAGALYTATITVWNVEDVMEISENTQGVQATYEVTLADEAAEPVYQLATSAYVSGGGTPVSSDGTPLADVKGDAAASPAEEVA